ncbi:MAG: site-specific DNA-methyltransferase [Dermatophilaceae bacterium]
MSDVPENFNIASEDPLADRLASLRATFPEVFREDRVDIDSVRRSVGDWVDPGSERFGLTWPGKAECMRVIQRPSIGTLVPQREESVDFDATQNVIIEGENLEVLKLLQKAYYGKVKLIYIDPPYNTGNEFIYPDNFKEGLADYLKYSGQLDDEGFKVSANAETDGRYHSKWLSMMYPRLFLARNLLREDGVIFVSIDDHEVHNLRAIMNEVFGEENFIAMFIWEKRTTRENRRAFSISHDYIVCFARGKIEFELTRGLLPLTEAASQRYSNPDQDPRGEWQSVSLNAQAGHGTRAQFYEITTPGRRVLAPPPGRCWSVTRPRLDELIADNRIWFGADGMNVPRLKAFRFEAKEGLTPHTLWRASEVGTNDSAKKYLLDLFGGEATFDTPKPVGLLERIVEIGAPGSEDIVLDFFAGSGTTGEAVMRVNSKNGGERRYVMVQLPEQAEGMSAPSIAGDLRRRVRLAGERARSVAPTLDSGDSRTDTGFRAYALARSNFTVWSSEANDADTLTEQLELAVQHVREGGTEEAMLTELLLKAGYSLTSPVELLSLAGIGVHSVADGALLVCLAGALSIELFEAIVELEPAMILVLDAGFGGNDELKVNALQAVRARNQRTGSDIVLRVV